LIRGAIIVRMRTDTCPEGDSRDVEEEAEQAFEIGT
jgi:hypothetical protein